MTTIGTQAATCSGRGFPPDPTLAEFLSTWSLKLAAGNYLWKEYGRVLQTYQDRHYVVKPIPAVGVHRLGKDTAEGRFEFPEIH